jgi:hypothetical protein
MFAVHEKSAPPGQPEFQVFLKETFQACIHIFNEVKVKAKPSSTLGSSWNFTETEHNDLVQKILLSPLDSIRRPYHTYESSAREFPMTVLVGSEIYLKLQEAIRSASNWVDILADHVQNPSFSQPYHLNPSHSMYPSFLTPNPKAQD